MPGKTFRNYLFTIFDMEWNITKGMEEEIDYMVYQHEICPETKRSHYQGYIEIKKKKGIKGVQTILGNKCHVEARKGTQAEAIAYCTKTESRKQGTEPIHFGQPRQQGERVDLNEIKDSIVQGATSVDEIVLEDPETYHQYGRTLSKIEDLVMRKKYRTEMTKGTWYWGPTGVGKSHKAFEGFNPDTHYLMNCNDKGWWEGYAQQETVIINDFRGEIPYNQLLNLVDKWPFNVPRRNREPMPFTSKHVIITSSLPPNKVYVNREAEDSLKQLLERFNVIHIDGASKRLPEVVRG